MLSWIEPDFSRSWPCRNQVKVDKLKPCQAGLVRPMS